LGGRILVVEPGASGEDLIAVLQGPGVHMGLKEVINEGDGFFLFRLGGDENAVWKCGKPGCLRVGIGTESRNLQLAKIFDREALHGGVGLVQGAGYLGVRDLGSGHDETLLVKTWMGTSRGCESVGVVIRSSSCPSAATGIRGRRGVSRGDSRSVGCGLVS
jgi:hypothetical protein